jgi:hypothetical protein
MDDGFYAAKQGGNPMMVAVSDDHIIALGDADGEVFNELPTPMTLKEYNQLAGAELKILAKKG